MMNPKTPKSAALAKLRNMVSEMMNEDFHSNKVPRLMALKVTKVGPQVDNKLDSDPMNTKAPMDAMHTDSPLEEMNEAPAEEAAEHDATTCPTCGGSGKTPMAASMTMVSTPGPSDSDHVSKLKQLLNK